MSDVDGHDQVQASEELPAFLLGDAWQAAKDRLIRDPEFVVESALARAVGGDRDHELRSVLRQETERLFRSRVLEAPRPGFVRECARLLEEHRPDDGFELVLTLRRVDSDVQRHGRQQDG